MLLGSVSVYAVTETSMIYSFFSKKAEVRIETFTLKNGVYCPWENDVAVLPGAYLSNIPIIYNEGIACYIRAKVDIISEQKASIPITIEDIDGISEKWVQIGDYFYYKDIFSENSEVVFFEGIQIPQDWDASIDSGNRWKIQITADAVQADYLVPDFQSDDPWGLQKQSYEILDVKQGETLRENILLEDTFGFTISSELDGFETSIVEIGTEGISLEEIGIKEIGIEEKFQDIGGFVPGNAKERAVRVCNLAKEEKIFYVRADVSQESELLKAMNISVLWKCQEREMILYQGPMYCARESIEQIRLVVPEESEGILVFQLSLPQDEDNNCSAQEGRVKFILTNEMHESIVMPEENGTEENGMEDNRTHGNSTGDDLTEPEYSNGVFGNSMVQTGDDNAIWIWTASICGALIVLLLIPRKRGSDWDDL